ncbi:MAG: hypothetical protein ACE3JQ_04065 [Paenisporosarcina sp.]
MSENREKEVFSDPTVLVTVNGVQVWMDNSFVEDTLDKNLHPTFEDLTAIDANEIQKENKKMK